MTKDEMDLIWGIEQMEKLENYPHPLKISIIEHNPSALRGFLNNPKWYAYGHKIKK